MSATTESVAECIRAISTGHAIGWTVFGSVTAYTAFQVLPGIHTARRDKRKLDLEFESVLYFVLFTLAIIAIGVAAAVIATPTEASDAVVWGLGAQGFIAGIVAGGGRFLDTPTGPSA